MNHRAPATLIKLVLAQSKTMPPLSWPNYLMSHEISGCSGDKPRT